MSIIRKYNTKTKQWEVVASSNASDISVRSEALLDESQNETNVETVLQKFNDDIKTLKGNVSWLAEHGGGGSGSGGDTTIEATIKINGKESGETIILDTKGLIIEVQSKKANVKWTISVSTDSKLIRTVNNTNKVTITSEELDKLGITSSFNLSVTAVNNDTLTSVYWNGRIQRSTVVISTKDIINFKYIDLPKSAIAFNYNIGVLGTYTLYINDVQIGDPYSLKYMSGEISVSLQDIVDAGVTLEVGNNIITSRLQSAQTPEIKSEDYKSTIILTAETPIISCPSLSEDINNRSTIYITPGENTILLTPYTVYYTSGTFKTQIYIQQESTKKSWDDINIFNYYNTLYKNASVLVTQQEYDVNINIIIAIKDSKSQVEYTKTFYGVTRKPSYNLLDNKVTPIFKFQSYFNTIIDNSWDSDNVKLTINNPNVKSSSILVSDNRSLRLQNAAYGVITNKGNQSFYYDYFTEATKQFTLSICYRADFHPDDDRTVLQFAEVDTQHLPLSGIIIRDHKLYIANNSFDLEDSELMTITITYKQQPNSELGTVFVYVNSVVETVFTNVNVSSIIPSEINTIYIAAQVENGNPMYFTDQSVYRVALYNKCLNPIEVLFDYLNDQALTHLINNAPDESYISNGLKRNFITTNENNEHISLLYNTNEEFDNNKTNFSDNFTFTNLISIVGTNVEIKRDISNYIVPIPLILIDASKSNDWTWNNFITPNAKITTAYNCSFEYYDQNGSNQSIIKGNCTLDLQGTSTLADAIKNLEIIFANNTVFAPTETWFPEQVYTLKADIVDSSHSLNTSIGKFVNTELGFTYNDDGTFKSTESWYPYSETVSNSFISAKNAANSPIKKYFPKATLKHGVEGFPVFLIIRFKGNSSEDTGLHSMGIYQFILGRKSPRNLGYEIINGIDGIETENITYPFYQEGVTISVKENKGYWLEMNKNKSFSIDFKFQEKDDISNTEFSDGLFWQEDDTKESVFYNDITDIKYTNMGDQAVSAAMDFQPFKEFISNVVKLPVTNRRYCISGNNELLKHTFSNCTYPKYVSKQSSDGIIWERAEGNNVIVDQGDNLESVLNKLNIESYAQYFVIAMFFGLVDNFMKNMPLKFYQKSDGTWENPLLGIYDTDTGLGGDNEGELTVSESVWLSTLENVNGVLQETSSQPVSPKTIIIGQNNKLWYFDSDELNYTENWGKGGSLFTAKWHSFIKLLQEKYKDTEYAINSLEDLVNLYYKKYFLRQTNGCGELLFNLTYFTKYLNTYINNGTYQNQASKLHGRRQQQILRWMKNRVKFLDSIYTALGVNSSMNDSAATINSTNVNINSGSVPSFILVSNYPVITSVQNQGSGTVFMILNKNKETSVNWGSNKIVSQSVGHGITYSDSIQRLGGIGESLSSIFYEKINNGSLPYVTVFNASSCQTLTPTTDATQYFLLNNKSELREIDLQGTAKTTPINYVLKLTSGYEKLQKLNLFKSCVSKIELPSSANNIPLTLLDVRDSQLTNLDLEEQNLLTSLDLTNCTKLNTLRISNCAKITSLSLDETQENIKTVNIGSDTFESFDCIENNSITTVSIDSSKLKRVNIIKCPKLTSLSISGTSLKYLNLEGCTGLDYIHISDPSDSIDFLHLNNTNIAGLQYNNGNFSRGIIDLSVFSQINDINLQNNPRIQKIIFKNEGTSRITINHPFTGLPNLERVYGHINVETNNLFNGCSKFSIHGTSPTKYNDRSIKAPDGRILFFTEIDGLGGLFQHGNYVTNITFNTTEGALDFANTACTLFDMYYVFFNIGNLTNCSQLFYGCKNIDYSWTNTCDNSLNRNMFMNCGKVQNLSYAIPPIKNPTRYFSPSHNDTEVLEDNGLLSPLVSCTNISGDAGIGGLLGCPSASFDRFLFRRKEGNYKFENINWSYANYLVNNINDLTVPVDADYCIQNYGTIGNFKDFFYNLPKVTGLEGFNMGGYLINYNTLNIPTITHFRSFNSVYAIGTINLDKIFINASRVTKIQCSFIASGGKDEDTIYNYITKATFNITDKTLQNFTSLQTWAATQQRAGELYTDFPFSGKGFIKQFGQNSFPYQLFNNTKLITVQGFFYDTDLGTLGNNTVEVPGELFKYTTNLQNVNSMFSHVPFNMKLTSNGFSSCPKLQSVVALFKDSQDKIKSTIPQKFFYHGQSIKSITYTGANLWNEDKSGYKYNPLALNEDGSQVGIKKEDLQTITITYNEPNTNILYMKNCFEDCNFETYENTSPTIENNKEFLPLTHIVQNNTVKINKNFNDKETICMWEYDGVNLPAGYNGENFDCEHTEEVSSIQMFDDYTLPCSLHFMCAPDLLRYCKNSSSLQIQNLFANCGYRNSNTRKANALPNLYEYGLKGRIPPYLLKSLSSLVDFSRVFQHCTCISPYITKDNVAYVIPETFFTYAPKISRLDNTFEGFTFPYNASLNVFYPLNSGLYLNRLFLTSRFNGTSTNKVNISGIFQNKIIMEANRVFAAIEAGDKINNTYNRMKLDQYVSFTSNFTKNKVVKNADISVFDGYSARTVSFGNKSLDNLRNNYRTS